MQKNEGNPAVLHRKKTLDFCMSYLKTTGSPRFSACPILQCWISPFSFEISKPLDLVFFCISNLTMLEFSSFPNLKTAGLNFPNFSNLKTDGFPEVFLHVRLGTYELISGFAKGGGFRTGVFRPEAHVKLTAPCRRHFAKQAGNGSRMNHPFCEYTNGSFCGTGGWVC